MNAISRHIAEIGTTPMAYADTGQGPVLVLLHGFCGSSAYWDSVIPTLSKDYRVIAPDLRGHGLSGLPNEPATMDCMADDIAGLMNHLHIPQATVLGHSLGGYVTLALYERYPELCQAMGLIHSTALPDSRDARDNRAKAIASIHDNGIIPFVDQLIPKLFSPNHLDTCTVLVNKALQIGYRTNPQGAIRALEGMRMRPDRNEVLQHARVPVLLIAGSDDQVVPPARTFSVDQSEHMHVTIQGAGHMSMMETPERCAEAIASFLASL